MGGGNVRAVQRGGGAHADLLQVKGTCLPFKNQDTVGHGERSVRGTTGSHLCPAWIEPADGSVAPPPPQVLFTCLGLQQQGGSSFGYH